MLPVFFVSLLAAAAASAIPAAAPPKITPTPVRPTTTNAHCPTVTRTGYVCPSCALPACILLSTVSNPCHCPTPVPTVTVDFPCSTDSDSAPLCHAGCGTSYVFAAPTSKCPPPTAIPLAEN
ncbi:hypothetical protein VTK73DRAFT_9892 [Phialemonium thermophilum]|uniref:Uncharacterized protein n=1 Tax=Phialemonium thermophilum TaxID=223376 RepID=A0ABR3VZK2_9PEZI